MAFSPVLIKSPTTMHRSDSGGRNLPLFAGLDRPFVGFCLKIQVRTPITAQIKYESRIAMASILTVDDSVSLRQLVAATLTRAGHEVAEAENGEHGLEVAKTNKFQLIISDINMPVMETFSVR